MIDIAWPEGELYSCIDGDETLHHEDPWSAIEEYLDGFLYPKIPVAELVEQLERTITLTAYRRMTIGPNQIAIWSSLMVENLGEMMGEEYGEPDGGSPLPDDADVTMLEAVTKIVRASRVWACEECGSIEVSGEQVLALARQERPDWFEEVP